MRINPKVLVFAAMFLCSCAISDKEYNINYLGDGSFQDRGIHTANNRFVVDFGYIDLGSKGKKVFNFSGLPDRFMVLQVVVPDVFLSEYGDLHWLADKSRKQEHLDSKKKILGLDVRLNIQLSKSNGTQEFEVEGVLSECIWSGKYNKPSIEIFMLTYKSECEGVWNTNREEHYQTPHFLPSADQSYQLTVEVLEPSKHLKNAKIIATGGGWKAP